MIVKEAICFMKNLREILALQTLHLSIEKPILDGRRASAIQAALRRRRAGDAWLGQCSKVWMRSTGCSGLSVMEQHASLIGALNSPHDKSVDKRQRLETKPISRGTRSSNPSPSSGESGANLTFCGCEDARHQG